MKNYKADSVTNNSKNDNFIEEENKSQNRNTRTLHKGIECVHCTRIFDCEGHLDGLCVNFQSRD